jgi:hypothetical protein
VAFSGMIQRDTPREWAGAARAWGAPAFDREGRSP